MSREEQIRRYGMKAQFWPDLGLEAPEDLDFEVEIVDKLPKNWLKIAKRLSYWAFIDKKKFNKFQIIGFDELEGGQTTICPLKIFATVNYMGSTDQILVLDGSRSYLLLRGKSASSVSFALAILKQEDFEMYDSRATYDIISCAIEEKGLPPFDVEETKKIMDEQRKKTAKERERRNLIDGGYK